MYRKSFLLLISLLVTAFGLSVLQHSTPMEVVAAPVLQSNCMFTNFTSADSDKLDCDNETCGAPGCDVTLSPLTLPTCASPNGPYSIEVTAEPCESGNVCAPILTVYDANGRIQGCGGYMTLGLDGKWRGSCSCVNTAPTSVNINYVGCGSNSSKGFQKVQVKICCTSGC